MNEEGFSFVCCHLFHFSRVCRTDYIASAILPAQTPVLKTGGKSKKQQNLHRVGGGQMSNTNYIRRVSP